MHRTHINRNIRTYNQQAIEAWKQELANIPLEIAQNEKVIRENQSQLDIYQPQLEQLRIVKITPLERQMLCLQAKINVLTFPAVLDDLREKVVPYDSRLAMIKHELHDVMATIAACNNEISQFETMIKIIEAKEEQKKLISEIDKSLEQITSLQEELQNKNYNKIDLGIKINHEQNNLNALRTDLKITYQDGNVPLLQGLRVAALETVIAEYETKQQTCTGNIEELNKKLSSRRSKVSEAREKLEENKNRIRRLEQTVQERNYSEQISSLHESIAKKRIEMRPYETRKTALESEQREKKTHFDRLQKDIIRLNKELNDSRALAGEISDQSVFKIEAQLQSLKADRNEIGKEETRLNEIIEAHKGIIQTELTAIDSKKKRLKELFANTFLMDLTGNADLLLSKFHELLHTSLESYEDAHPVNQPDNVRLCLVETNNKLNVLANLSDYANQDSKQRYYILCGLLWKMLDKADGGLDVSLAEVIMDILRKNPVDLIEAKSAYTELCSKHPDALTDLGWGDYLGIQRDAYANALRNLEAALYKLPAVGKSSSAILRRHGYELLQSIVELKQKAELEEQTFDIKFYTAVLHKSAALLQEPGDPIQLEKFHNLLEANTDGTSSSVKKVSGSMLMLAGATALAASFVLPKFSDRVPVSAAVAGGGMAFLFGAGLFGSGMQKSTVRTMTRFEQSAIKEGNERNLRYGNLNR